MYAKIKDNTLIQYPYGFSELQADNPSSNFGSYSVWDIFPQTDAALVDGFTLVEVSADMAPSYDQRTQNVTRLTQPILRDGVWVLTWVIEEKTAEQLATDTAEMAHSVRKDRMFRLFNSDWTQVADAPVDKFAWATYRQALRDITAQSGFPWEVTWPTAPQ
jgi:hypothetical protein